MKNPQRNFSPKPAVQKLQLNPNREYFSYWRVQCSAYAVPAYTRRFKIVDVHEIMTLMKRGRFHIIRACSFVCLCALPIPYNHKMEKKNCATVRNAKRVFLIVNFQTLNILHQCIVVYDLHNQFESNYYCFGLLCLRRAYIIPLNISSSIQCKWNPHNTNNNNIVLCWEAK